MNSREKLAALHQQILAKDPTAPTRLFEALGTSVPGGLFRKYGRTLTFQDCEDFAVDAFMTYLASPGKFDPERASLSTYLFLIAQSAILRRLRHNDRTAAFTRDAVELEALDVYNEGGGEVSDGPAEAYQVTMAKQEVAIRRPRIHLTPNEEAAFDLMLSGERSTKAFALVLGLAALPPDEQRKQVKRFKDRVGKRIDRLEGPKDGQ